MWPTLKQIVTHGPARKAIITDPLKKKAEPAASGHHKTNVPSVAQLAMARMKQEKEAKEREAKANSAGHKRNLEDLLGRDWFDLD